MTIIGLKELRQNTEAVAERVARGESFIVVRRSKPIFKLVPPSSDTPGVDAWLDSYISQNRPLLDALADK